MSDAPLIHRQLWKMVAGDLLGSGMSRSTFACATDPTSVIKVEDGAGDFQNVIEWETWQRVKDTKHSRWFAICRHISPDGSILVMERTQPVRMAELPKRMPSFLSDFKRTNYGMSNGWLVCHDYGTNLLFERGMNARMRSADWSDR